MLGTRTIALLAVIVAATVVCGPVRAQLPGTRRIDLQQQALSIPGYEVIQARVELDPGVSSSRHTHPGEEIVYVIEGSLEYRIDGRSPIILRAGEVLSIPADTAHAAKNVGVGGGAELATYIVKVGKPLVEVVN